MMLGAAVCITVAVCLNKSAVLEQQWLTLQLAHIALFCLTVKP